MSRLRVFYGDGNATGTAAALDARAAETAVLSYQDHAGRWDRFRREPLQRAATLRRNDCCPRCRRALVEPVELNDGFTGRNNLPIPGTATLVGFRCQCCRWEWPV